MFLVGINSYAQNFEDVMLWRALGHIQNGFYIDVGANDPVVDSVSLAFYEHGWRGVHIEATHKYSQLLRENRPDEVVLEVALSNQHGVITFYEIPETGLSTGDKSIAGEHIQRGFSVKEISIPCITLSDVFEQVGSRDIHWLKIDVEGFERQVLEGWAEHQARPWIVVIESTLPLTTIESYENWETILLEEGYTFVYFDGLNRFYVSDNHIELKQYFSAPPNVFDGFTLNGTASTSMHQLLQSRYEDEKNKLAILSHELEQLKSKAEYQIQAITEAHQEDKRALGLSFDIKERDLLSQIGKVRTELTAQTQRSAEHLTALARREKEWMGREQSLNGLMTQMQDSKHSEAKKYLESLVQREKEFASELLKLRESADAQRHSIENQHKEAITELSNGYIKREENLISQIESIRIELKAQTELSAEHLIALARREKEFATELLKLRESADAKRQSIEIQHKEMIAELSNEYQIRESNFVSQIENIRIELRTQTERSTEYLITLREREKEFVRELKQMVDEKHTIELKNSDLSHLLTAAQLLGSQLHDELAMRQQMLADLSRELATIRGSLSWRITAPLRAIGTLFTSSHPDSKVVSMMTKELEDTSAQIEKSISVAKDCSVDTDSAVIDSCINAIVKEPSIPQPEQPIIYIKETFMSSSPIVAATSVDELLAYHDADFIHCAYTTLLGRVPDPEGMNYYLHRLRAGRAKIAIIDQLLSSVEAKNYNASVAGLKQALGRYRWEKMPIIGMLFRKDTIVQEIRQIESNMYRLNQDMNRRFDAVEQQIKQISYTVVASSDIQTLGEENQILENNPDLSHMSVTARRIYAQLNARGNK